MLDRGKRWRCRVVSEFVATAPTTAEDEPLSHVSRKLVPGPLPLRSADAMVDDGRRNQLG